MNPQNSYRRQKKAPNAPYAAGYRAIETAWIIFSRVLSIIILPLTLQSPNHANAETNNLDHSVPPPPKILTAPIEFNEPRGALSLSGALSVVLSRNPALAAVTREIRAQDGAVRQAGLLPNPVFGASAQNFGNSVLRGFDGNSLNLSLSQTILLGGKRAKAIRVAELDRDLAVWDYESKRRDVLTELIISFVEVLKDQQRLILVNGLVTLANRTLDAVSTRVRAGAISPVDETRARVSLASVQIEQQRAERALITARQRLAATWGSTTPRFDMAQGKLEAVRPIPSFDTLMDRLAHNPDLARWASETVQRQASIELAESRAMPNLTVSFGVQQFLRTGDNALGAGISIPLPFFDRNQGRINEAHQRFHKTLDERRDIRILIITTLNTVYQQLSADYAEVGILETTVLPGAESAFEAIEKGYRLGKFNLLDVLVAQRTLFDAKIQHLGALAGYHQSKAKIERLIGEFPEAARNIEAPK